MDIQLGKALNLTREVNGMPVMMLQRGDRLGQVIDTIVHPTKGVVLGVVLLNVAGKEQHLSARDCFIYQEAQVIIVTPDAWEDIQDTPSVLAGGVRVNTQLLNLEVVTNHGKSLGRVMDVYATEVELRTIYRVATSRWRFFPRDVLFLPGDLPLAWLEKGARLIVPAEAMERESFSSLKDALRSV